jgi:hypothetical protein
LHVATAHTPEEDAANAHLASVDGVSSSRPEPHPSTLHHAAGRLDPRHLY